MIDFHRSSVKVTVGAVDADPRRNTERCLHHVGNTFQQAGKNHGN
jgi:hypothetical protein